MNGLERLLAQLRASRGFVHKQDIAAVVQGLDAWTGDTVVPNGDDCAVVSPGPGQDHLLFAIEGLVQDFVEAMPWFAGYSAVMVNLSDVAAMGGRSLAVVNALWAHEDAVAQDVLAGMRAASQKYGVPMVGGHTNLRSANHQLAVAVLGTARRLISSFDAQPGDRLVVAVDLRGQWQEPYPFWNASVTASAEQLRGDMEVLPRMAEAGWCAAGKDISMAGVLGSLLMLLECSGVGGVVDLECLPVPPSLVTATLEDEAGVSAWLRWLCAFPSYGYVLSVRPEHVAPVVNAFAERGLAAADVGGVTAGSRLVVQHGAVEAELWDHAQTPFIGAGRATCTAD